MTEREFNCIDVVMIVHILHVNGFYLRQMNFD